MINLENTKKIYFIGVGGIGMSALAGIAKAKGYEISGSDSSDIYHPSKAVLDKYGIKYHIGFDLKNIVQNQDKVSFANRAIKVEYNRSF